MIDVAGNEVVKIGDVTNIQHMSNAQHIMREISDTLGVYYRVARKRFLDNVRMQVVDRLLLKGPESPLKIFSPGWVAGLDAGTLETIAGEEPIMRRRRHDLAQRIKRLEEGKKILQ